MPEPRAIVPDKGVRGCYNETGSTLPAKRFVSLNTSGTQPRSVALTGDDAAAYGVTMQDIPNLAWGDVQVEGTAIMTAGGTIGIGLGVSSAASGVPKVADSGSVINGKAITAGATSTDMEVELGASVAGVAEPA